MQGMMSKQARTDPIVTALEAVARETGRTLAQVALSWLRTWPVPVIPIRSARRVDQFQDNLASLTLSLIPEQVKTLNAASAIPGAHVSDGDGRQAGPRRHAGAHPGVTQESLPAATTVAQGVFFGLTQAWPTT